MRTTRPGSAAARRTAGPDAHPDTSEENVDQGQGAIRRARDVLSWKMPLGHAEHELSRAADRHQRAEDQAGREILPEHPLAGAVLHQLKDQGEVAALEPLDEALQAIGRG